MNMRITTWNTDWCRDGIHTTGDDKYYSPDCSDDVYNRIKMIISNYLSDLESIVCLQEFPQQKISILMRDFPNHKLIYINKRAKRYTLWIVPQELCETIKITNDVLQKDEPKLHHNRISVFCKDGIHYIGVHMPTNFELFDSDHHLWLSLINYIKKTKDFVIVGDFNAYIGCNNKTTEKLFASLLDHCVCVSNNVQTYLCKTPIDHILISNALYPRIDGFSESQKELDGSDHLYLTSEIAFSKAIA